MFLLSTDQNPKYFQTGPRMKVIFVHSIVAIVFLMSNQEGKGWGKGFDWELMVHYD